MHHHLIRHKSHQILHHPHLLQNHHGQFLTTLKEKTVALLPGGAQIQDNFKQLKKKLNASIQIDNIVPDKLLTTL